MIDDADAAQGDEAADELVKSLARSSQEIRNARVIRIDNEFVWLDIGFKFESVLPLSAWQDDSPPNVGDEIMVLIEDDLDVDDRPLRIARVHVTRRNAGWRFVASAKPGDVHSGRITRRIAGGFLVKTNGRPVLAGRSRMAQLINAVIGSIRGHAIRTRNSVLDLPDLAESFPGNGQVVDPANPHTSGSTNCTKKR